VVVEKGTRAVISVNLSACGERTFNNLRANFVIEKCQKRVFQQPRDVSTAIDGSGCVTPCHAPSGIQHSGFFGLWFRGLKQQIGQDGQGKRVILKRTGLSSRG
jgi:hypothetical protein